MHEHGAAGVVAAEPLDPCQFPVRKFEREIRPPERQHLAIPTCLAISPAIMRNSGSPPQVSSPSSRSNEGSIPTSGGRPSPVRLLQRLGDHGAAFGGLGERRQRDRFGRVEQLLDRPVAEAAATECRLPPAAARFRVALQEQHAQRPFAKTCVALQFASQSLSRSAWIAA